MHALGRTSLFAWIGLCTAASTGPIHPQKIAGVAPGYNLAALGERLRVPPEPETQTGSSDAIQARSGYMELQSGENSLGDKFSKEVEDEEGDDGLDTVSGSAVVDQPKDVQVAEVQQEISSDDLKSINFTAISDSQNDTGSYRASENHTLATSASATLTPEPQEMSSDVVQSDVVNSVDSALISDLQAGLETPSPLEHHTSGPSSSELVTTDVQVVSSDVEKSESAAILYSENGMLENHSSEPSASALPTPARTEKVEVQVDGSISSDSTSAEVGEEFPLLLDEEMQIKADGSVSVMATPTVMGMKEEEGEMPDAMKLVNSSVISDSQHNATTPVMLENYTSEPPASTFTSFAGREKTEVQDDGSVPSGSLSSEVEEEFPLLLDDEMQIKADGTVSATTAPQDSTTLKTPSVVRTEEKAPTEVDETSFSVTPPHAKRDIEPRAGEVQIKVHGSSAVDHQLAVLRDEVMHFKGERASTARLLPSNIVLPSSEQLDQAPVLRSEPPGSPSDHQTPHAGYLLIGFVILAILVVATPVVYSRCTAGEKVETVRGPDDILADIYEAAKNARRINAAANEGFGSVAGSRFREDYPLAVGERALE